MSAHSSTLAGLLVPAKAHSRLRAALLVLAGVALLTLSAKVQVPFWPVPVTLQTLAVPLVAAALGARLGTASVLSYLALGFAGMPVFASAMAGPASFVGPTAGYLLAYPLAAWIAGHAAERFGNRGVPLFIAMIAGDAIVLACGCAWLAVFLGGMKAAWLAGVAPFLLADLIKVSLAAALIATGWSAASKTRA